MSALNKWLAWPVRPLMCYSAALLALLALGGTRWSLIPPILWQATPLLLILTLAFPCVGAQIIWVAIKFIALVAWIIAWWRWGSWEKFPLMDDASTMALTDVYFTAILNLSLLCCLASQETRTIVLVADSFAGVMDPTILQSLPEQARLLRRMCLVIGVFVVLVWSLLCAHLNPSTLFPGQNFTEMVRSPAALPVFLMMLLTAMIGYADMGKHIDQECVRRMPESWRKPWAIRGCSLFITTGGILRAQVQIVLAAMWSLHLAGATTISALLLLDGVLSRPTDEKRE